MPIIRRYREVTNQHLPKAPCSTAELRTPIVFVRSERTPDDHTGFVQTLTKFGRAWAKVTYGTRQLQGKEASSYAYTHRFIIRNPGWVPGVTDFVICQQSVCQISGTKILGLRDEWLRLDANEVMQIDSAPFFVVAEVEGVEQPATVIVSEAPEEAEPESVADDENNFWEDEAP